jgi:hypothetical protein
MGRHQVVVGEHGQAAAGHLGQLSDVQVRLGGGHLADLGRHDLEVVDAIGGDPARLVEAAAAGSARRTVRRPTRRAPEFRRW